MGRLEGKVAIVTGGARGLGAADAVRLASEGARVIITDVLDGAEIAKTIRGIFMKHDVSDEDGWRSVVATADREFGRLDILVNNAGILIPGNVETTKIADLRRMFAVGIEGALLGVKHALPLLRASGAGSIINMSSITAMRHFTDTLGYATVKGALRSMTKSIAGHCRQHGYPVRCNSIHPSGIDTSMVRDRLRAMGGDTSGPPPTAAALAIGMPDDVANLVVFLASDESRYINGAELVIDDGYCAI